MLEPNQTKGLLSRVTVAARGIRPVLMCTILTITAIAMSGCASIRTHSDYDPTIQYTDYRSFTWRVDDGFDSRLQPQHPYISPLDIQRIERAIESELLARGYEQLDNADDADFLVSFTVGARDKIDIDRYPVAVRGRWVHHWPYYHVYESVDVHNYTEGVLAIDIYDREMARPAWHGVARKRISETDANRRGAVIQEAVAAILSAFPPM